MIDVKRLRQDPAGVRAALARRLDPSLAPLIDDVIVLDTRRRELLTRVEALKAERNTANDEVARRKRAKEPAEELFEALRRSGDEVKELDDQVRGADDAITAALLRLPNIPLPEVPDGDATRNRVLRSWGTAPSFAFAPRAHWDLGTALGLFDLPRGAKIARSGFPLFTGAGSRLVRALQNFMLDLHTRTHGYVEVSPPLLVNRATLTATGQLPKFEEDVYATPADDFFLVPTAEVPLTNIHRDEILDGAALPMAYTACTPCFRREAGAHGKDTRGLIRVHQFDKVELVRLVRPADSPAEHEKMTAHAEAVLQALELPYRVVALAAGDTGFSSAKTWDLEVWAPGVGGWLEVSSSSSFTDYQARRANIRFRADAKAKPEFVHTLNASGVAFPRAIIALLETHQQADGTVSLPAALRPYFGADRLAGA
ncbi:MAG: serine--tRNA ligase [Gemmatimonadales bacterium]